MMEKVWLSLPTSMPIKIMMIHPFYQIVMCYPRSLNHKTWYAIRIQKTHLTNRYSDARCGENLLKEINVTRKVTNPHSHFKILRTIFTVINRGYKGWQKGKRHIHKWPLNESIRIYQESSLTPMKSHENRLLTWKKVKFMVRYNHLIRRSFLAYRYTKLNSRMYAWSFFFLF